MRDIFEFGKDFYKGRYVHIEMKLPLYRVSWSIISFGFASKETWNRRRTVMTAQCSRSM